MNEHPTCKHYLQRTPFQELYILFFLDDCNSFSNDSFNSFLRSNADKDDIRKKNEYSYFILDLIIYFIAIFGNFIFHNIVLYFTATCIIISIAVVTALIVTCAFTITLASMICARKIKPKDRRQYTLVPSHAKVPV